MGSRLMVPLIITRVGCRLEFRDVLKSKKGANIAVILSFRRLRQKDCP